MKEAGINRAISAGEWRGGWPLVLCASIGIAVASINYPVLATLMRTITSSYGWSRGEVALGTAIITTLAPLTNLVVGAAGDRFGPRRVALVSAPVFGLAYAGFALAGPAPSSWYVACMVYALCVQLAGPVVWTMAVVRQFRANRGLTLAVALSGSAVVTSTMPGIVLFLLGRVGLRGTFLVLAATAAAAMFVLTLLLFRGDEPSRRPSGADAATSAELSWPARALPGLTLGQALCGTRFWRLALALALVAATVGTFLIHFQSMLLDSGLAAGQAASVAIMIGPMMIVGRLATGTMFDRFPTPLVSSLAFSILAVACGLMLAFDGSIAMALLVAVAIGLGMGAEVDVIAYLTSHYFGLRHYGMMFGPLMGLYGVVLGRWFGLGWRRIRSRRHLFAGTGRTGHWLPPRRPPWSYPGPNRPR